MAFTTVAPFVYPAFATSSPNPLSANTLVSDASGEKFMQVGVAPKDGTLDRIHVYVNATTNNQTIRVSIQPIDATTGWPTGTQSFYRDFSVTSADDTVWKDSGLITDNGADNGNKKSLTAGTQIAIVFERQSTFNTGDIFRCSTSVAVDGLSYNSLYTTSWQTRTASVINMVLEYSDGSFVYFGNPTGPSTSVVTQSGTNPVRYGNRIIMPFGCKIIGFHTVLVMASNGDYDFTFTDNTGKPAGLIEQLKPTAIDTDLISGTSGRGHAVYFSSPYTLVSGTTYYIFVEATAAVNLTHYYQAFSTQAQKEGIVGSHTSYATQHSTNDPTVTTTRSCFMYPIIVAIDFPAGGAGGLITHPGMAGGMRG